MRRFSLSLLLLLAWSAVLTVPTAAAAVPFQTQIFVIPVAVSSPGQNGSFYRTAVQAYNGGLSPIVGTFIFRPQGVSTATPGATMEYTIDPGKTIVFEDLLAAMGQSGIGSVDVTASSGTAAPVLSVRVFNDGGAAGTTGFTENVKTSADVLGAGANVVLVAPSDPTAFRFNIGVRTFTAGATIDVSVRDQAGHLRNALSLTYPPNFFQQIDAASFLGGLAADANDTLTAYVRAGGLLLYATTADNRTNDPALQEPQRILFTPPIGTPTF